MGEFNIGTLFRGIAGGVGSGLEERFLRQLEEQERQEQLRLAQQQREDSLSQQLALIQAKSGLLDPTDSVPGVQNPEILGQLQDISGGTRARLEAQAQQEAQEKEAARREVQQSNFLRNMKDLVGDEERFPTALQEFDIIFQDKIQTDPTLRSLKDSLISQHEEAVEDQRLAKRGDVFDEALSLAKDGAGKSQVEQAIIAKHGQEALLEDPSLQEAMTAAFSMGRQLHQLQRAGEGPDSDMGLGVVALRNSVEMGEQAARDGRSLGWIVDNIPRSVQRPQDYQRIATMVEANKDLDETEVDVLSAQGEKKVERAFQLASTPPSKSFTGSTEELQRELDALKLQGYDAGTPIPQENGEILLEGASPLMDHIFNNLRRDPDPFTSSQIQDALARYEYFKTQEKDFKAFVEASKGDVPLADDRFEELIFKKIGAQQGRIISLVQDMNEGERTREQTYQEALEIHQSLKNDFELYEENPFIAALIWGVPQDRLDVAFGAIERLGETIEPLAPDSKGFFSTFFGKN